MVVESYRFARCREFQMFYSHLTDSSEVSNPKRWPHFTPRMIIGTSFCYTVSKSQDNIAAKNIG
jgi:hypothetical protein